MGADAQHFPSLGGGSVVANGGYSGYTQTVVPAGSAWGPADVNTPQQQQQFEANMRSGVEFDSSHPRNSFAKKPYIKPAEVSQAAPVAIDWSQAGTQAIQQTMLHVAANPTVHGQTPGVSVYPSVPLNVLKSQPAVVQMQPSRVQQVYQKPVYQKITQGRGC